MEYASFSEHGNRVLTWQKAHIHVDEFQLSDGQQVYASLRWTGTKDREAIGTTADGRWVFKRAGARHLLDLQGRLKPRLVVQAAESNAEALEVPLGYAEAVNLGGKHSFRWTFSRDWSLSATRPPRIKSAGVATGMFTPETGEPLVTIRATDMATPTGRDLPEGEVTISSEAITLPELSVMVLIAWYGMRDGTGPWLSRSGTPGGGRR